MDEDPRQDQQRQDERIAGLESVSAAHGERIAMTAVLADKMGELKAASAEGFASIHRRLDAMSATLTSHAERITRLETERDTSDDLNRRWEDRNQERRYQGSTIRLSRWQVVIGLLTIAVMTTAVLATAVEVALSTA